jgi:hypothetical protein
MPWKDDRQSVLAALGFTSKISVKTAKVLGITIPTTLLVRADEVIE